MGLVINIKNNLKKIIYSRITWIVFLNSLLIIIPVSGLNFIRSRDHSAIKLRSTATKDLGRTIKNSSKMGLPPRLIENLPVVAPYQRIILLETDNATLIFDTGWVTNHVILSIEYDLFLTRFISKFVPQFSPPTLKSDEIISRMNKYIESETRKFSIINYRYIYYLNHFSFNYQKYSFIVLTDKSDLIIRSRVNKVILFLVSMLSMILGTIVSIIYYKLIIKPLHILTKEVKLLKENQVNPDETFTYKDRFDEIGLLSKAFYLTSKEIIDKKESFELFTNDILHELKNPLTSIRNGTEVLKLSNNCNTEMIDLISKEAGRIEKLLFDIKEYSSYNKNENLSKWCSPQKIIPQIMEIYFKYNIICTIQSKQQIPLSNEQFITILTNLLDNAISFSPQPGSVSINYYEKNNSLYLVISDQGKGINLQDREKIFNRFYTNRDTSNGNKLHSGLGLSIVKAILDSNKHKIECFDNRPKGTTFKITFN